MEKPWVKSPGLQLTFYLMQTLKFEIKLAKMHGEIFAFLCQLTKRPSVQALEIIRHVDASFYRK
jgi:hypothetical protein